MNDAEARTLLTDLLHRVAPEADLAEVADDAPLQEVLDLDSMDFLNLVTGLHDSAGIDVPERDYPLLASPGGFIAYVVRATSGGAFA